MPVKKQTAPPQTEKVKIPFTPAAVRCKEVFDGQELRRNTTRANLFGPGNSDQDDGREMMDVTQFEIDMYSEDENEEETDESAKRLDEMIIARMLSGASAQRTSKASEIYSTTVASAGGVVKGSTMALTLTDKKCKSLTMSAVVKFVREHHDFVFPTDEQGTDLRLCIQRLAADIRREFKPRPDELARTLIEILISSGRIKKLALNVFSEYMRREQDEVEEFEDECANGSVSTAEKARVDPTQLPFFYLIVTFHWLT